MKHIKLFEQYNKLNEGMWAFPFKAIDAEKLKDLMSEPLLTKVATDKLNGVLASDSLFDEIDDINRKDGEDIDVRPIVKEYLKKYLKQYEESPESFSEEISQNSMMILKNILNN